MAVGLMLSAFLNMGDDDDDDKIMYMTRLLINQAGRLQSDITFYISPKSFEQVIKNPLPIAKTYIDVHRFIKATANVMLKSNKTYDFDYWSRAAARTVPFGNNMVQLVQQAEEVY